MVARRNIRTHRSERGAALFVVVLVIAMLTTLGVFAAASASTGTHASGHMRQYTQTHYVTDYAMMGVMAELSTPRLNIYIDEMKKKKADNKCETTKQGLVPVVNATCYRFGYQDLEEQFAREHAGAQFVVPGTAGPAGLADATPGGLGHGGLDVNLAVELTDLGPSAQPVPGMDMADPNAPQFKQLTVTSTGIVFPRTTSNNANDKYVYDAARAMAMSLETGRGRLIVGPITESP